MDDHWQEVNGTNPVEGEPGVELTKTHRSFDKALAEAEVFPRLFLSEIAEDNNGLNLASRPIPALPHQFGKLAETIRGECKRKI